MCFQKIFSKCKCPDGVIKVVTRFFLSAPRIVRIVSLSQKCKVHQKDIVMIAADEKT